MAKPLVKIYKVPADMAAEIWPAVERFVAGACRYHPFMEPPDLLLLLQNRLARLFVATGSHGVLGFAAVEVVQYPSRRVCNGMLAGGVPGFLDVLRGEMLKRVQEWALEQGAEDISITGRPGWQRLAKREGWAFQTQVLIHKRLDHVRRRQPNSNREQTAVGASTALSH